MGIPENDPGVFEKVRNTFCQCAKFQDRNPMHFAVLGLLV